LNEGFAQYSSALYREQQYGMQSYWTYMNSQLDLAKSAIGEIGVADLSSVRNLFDPARIYAKGACVLHMLRHVLGDTIFFRSLRAYANNPVLKYNTAMIQDFQTMCESVSGKDLNYFFQEWIYGEGYPVYEYSWTWRSIGDSSAIVLDIGQTNHRGNPIFFAMPVDIRITAAGGDTVLTVFNDAQQQRFIIKADVKPSAVLLDPGEWILKIAFSEANRPPTEYTLEQNYPNPFNSATNIIYRIPRQQHVVLRIFDILGRKVAVLADTKQSPGSYECRWIPQDNASGIYFYRLVAGSIQLQKKMIFLK
jgi:hypothetical protein